MGQTVKSSNEVAGRPGAELCPGQLPVSFPAPRACGASARVRLERDHVRFCEPVGLAEVVRVVRIDDYLGIVVAVRHDGAREIAEVTLRHADPGLDIVLHTALNECDIHDLIRAWTIWSDALDIDRYVEMADGVLESVPSQVHQRPRPTYRSRPRRANIHFRSRRPCMESTPTIGDRIAGTEIIARH